MDTTAGRVRDVAVWVAVVGVLAVVGCMWQAGRVDAAVRVWALGQTLTGAMPLDAPLAGWVWRVGAAVSGLVAVVAAGVVDVVGPGR